MSLITIYSDGAARGNPGPAGAGAVLINSKGETVSEVCRYLGDSLTNNQAEYRALILALHEAITLNTMSVLIYADSELMVKQVRGEYKVKNEGIRPLFSEVMQLLKKIGTYKISHVPREKNKRADKLANLAIDGQV